VVEHIISLVAGKRASKQKYESVHLFCGRYAPLATCLVDEYQEKWISLTESSRKEPQGDSANCGSVPSRGDY
jgi:hypothetical protein